jgi:hypothetical protein
LADSAKTVKLFDGISVKIEAVGFGSSGVFLLQAGPAIEYNTAGEVKTNGL